MHNVNWNEIMQLNSVEEMWSTFKTNFTRIVDKHLPYKDRRIKIDSEKWITDEILTEMSPFSSAKIGHGI